MVKNNIQDVWQDLDSVKTWEDTVSWFAWWCLYNMLRKLDKCGKPWFKLITMWSFIWVRPLTFYKAIEIGNSTKWLSSFSIRLSFQPSKMKFVSDTYPSFSVITASQNGLQIMIHVRNAILGLSNPIFAKFELEIFVPSIIPMRKSWKEKLKNSKSKWPKQKWKIKNSKVKIKFFQY